MKIKDLLDILPQFQLVEYQGEVFTRDNFFKEFPKEAEKEVDYISSLGGPIKIHIRDL